MSSDAMKNMRDAIARGERFAMCTVIKSMGSSPGHEGQKMFVFADGTILGTIGGGINEENTRKKAMHQLHEGGTLTLKFDLSGSEGTEDPICGGRMDVFIEVLQLNPHIVIFGAGHIGLVIAQLASVVGYRVTLVDERPDVTAGKVLPKDLRILCCRYEDSVEKAEIDENTAVVIVTPGHVKDREVLERAIKYPARYIGMIGSMRKVKDTMGYLQKQGVSQKTLDEIFAPIGINLGGSSPEEIAIGIMAQIAAHKNGKRLHYSRNNDTAD